LKKTNKLSGSEVTDGGENRTALQLASWRLVHFKGTSDNLSDVWPQMENTYTGKGQGD
jgi:hypothetical protein